MNTKLRFLTSLKPMMQLAYLSILAVVLLSSCNKSAEQANYIPKDANVVLTVDVKSLGLKSMGFRDIFSLSRFKKLLSKSEAADTSLSNLKESGIDLLTNAYVFGSINEKSEGYGAAVIALSDEVKFENYAKKLFRQVAITTEGENKFAISLLEPNSIVVWNRKSALLLFQSPEQPVQIKERALSILNLKKEEPLASTNQNFEKFLKESSDLSVWINFESLGSVAKKFGATTASSNWKDNYLTMNCNFDKGQVVINSKYYANNETSEKFDLAKGTITKETAFIIPAESLIGMFGVSLDMNKVYTLLEKEQLVSIIEGQANKSTGMSVKDLFQIFNGQIVASFNGVIQQEVKSIDITTGKEEVKQENLPQFSLILGVNDKAKTSQLLATLCEKGVLTKEDNSYSIKNLYSVIDLGTHLVIVPENQKRIVLNQSGKKLSPENEAILTKNSAALYVNFKDIPESSLELLNPGQREWLKKIPVESVLVSSEALKDKVSNGKCLITFKEKDQNSIVTIAKISEELSKEDQSEEPSSNDAIDQNTEVAPKEPLENQVNAN